MSIIDLRENAHEYADRNWPVFPCLPRDKRPHGGLVPRGLKGATTAHDVIQRWWTEEPKANIGLPTGITSDVLDVDADGWETLTRLIGIHEHSFAAGAIAITGVGAHYHFLSTGLGNRVGFARGLDWRGKGGYVVAPPSVHPSGAIYEWAIPPNEMPMVAPPQWLLDLLTPKPKPAPRALPMNVRGSGYAQAALKSECVIVASTAEGSRNHVLNVAAFKVATLIAAGLLDPDDAATRLLSAAAECGLSETEARKTVASGFRAGLSQPRQVAS